MCSLNHVAAHYTPNPGDDDDVVLSYDDVMKVDFGVQIDGCIFDSAWTVGGLQPTLRYLVGSGCRYSDQWYVDVRLCGVGEAIQEVMESYEVELHGTTTYPRSSVYET